MKKNNDHQLHIVHVVRDLDPETGGLTRAVAQLAESLLERNIAGSVVFQVRNVPPIDLAAGLQKIQFPQLGWRDFAGRTPRLKNAVDQLNQQRPITLFHLHGLWDGLTNGIALIASQAGIRYVCSSHGMLAPWSLNHKRWKKRFAWYGYQKKTLQRAAALHATAEKESDTQKKLNLTAPRFVVPFGIPATPAIDLGKRQQNPRIALVLSRLHPVKGIEMLIEAWQNLRPKGWICEIIGPGETEYISSLRAKINASQLEKEVFLLPALEDHEKWTAYQRASVFLLPSFTENFGIVVAEALAMQLPVVTTTGTPWSMLPQKNCGWYIEPRRENLEAALIEALNTSPDKLATMGIDGKKFVDHEFGWPAISRQFENQYRSVLSAP